MPLKDIIGKVEANYSTRISLLGVWRAKQITNEVINSDFINQYRQLWPHITKLKDWCLENPRMIRVNKLNWRYYKDSVVFTCACKVKQNTFIKACR